MTSGGRYIELTPGMSLREHYAGLAMHGILANPNASTIVHRFGDDTSSIEPFDVALAAVKFADALIAELAKNQAT